MILEQFLKNLGKSRCSLMELLLTDLKIKFLPNIELYELDWNTTSQAKKTLVCRYMTFESK